MINRENFNDPEFFNRFIKNCEYLFRTHNFYKFYKSELFARGFDRCQVNGNISNEHSNIEMHHMLLTLYDLTLLITKSRLRRNEDVSSFIVVQDLIEAHKNFIVPIVMLSETNHERVHNGDLIIPYELIIGNMNEFIDRYWDGLTYSIIFKIMKYISLNTSNEDLDYLNNRLIQIRPFLNVNEMEVYYDRFNNSSGYDINNYS